MFNSVCRCIVLYFIILVTCLVNKLRGDRYESIYHNKTVAYMDSYLSPRSLLTKHVTSIMKYNTMHLQTLLCNTTLIKIIHCAIALHNNGCNISGDITNLQTVLVLNNIIDIASDLQTLHRLWTNYPIIHDGHPISDCCVTITDSYATISVEWIFRAKFLELAREDVTNEELTLIQWKSVLHPNLDDMEQVQTDISPRDASYKINKEANLFLNRISKVTLNNPTRIILIDTKKQLTQLKIALSPREHASINDKYIVSENICLYSILSWIWTRTEFLCRCNTFEDVKKYYIKYGAYSRDMILIIYNDKKDQLHSYIRKSLKALLLIMFLRLDEIITGD